MNGSEKASKQSIKILKILLVAPKQSLYQMILSNEAKFKDYRWKTLNLDGLKRLDFSQRTKDSSFGKTNHNKNLIMMNTSTQLGGQK